MAVNFELHAAERLNIERNAISSARVWNGMCCDDNVRLVVACGFPERTAGFNHRHIPMLTDEINVSASFDGGGGIRLSARANLLAIDQVSGR